MKVLDTAVFVIMFCAMVFLAVGLVTERHRNRDLEQKVWVLEQQVNALYLAADWDEAAL